MSAKRIYEAIKEFFFDLVFTKGGNALVGIAGSAYLGFMTYLTVGFENYQPAATAIALILGFVGCAGALRLLVSIYLVIACGLRTSAATFAEFKFENNNLILVSKGNIHNEPQIWVNHNFLQISPPPPAPAVTGSKKSATQATPPQSTTVPQMLQSTSAAILCVFDRPIANLHLKLEAILGQQPMKLGHTIDERWGFVEMQNLSPNSSFRVRFN